MANYNSTNTGAVIDAGIDFYETITASAAEINILDGVTATTAELNYVDGVTSNIQTQLDAKAPLNNASFTGDLSVNTDEFVVNSGSVGIGTATPSTPLHVVSTNGGVPSLGSQIGLFQNNGTTGTNSIFAILSGTAGVSGIQLGDTDNIFRGFVQYSNNGDYLYFGSAGAERMRITSSGDVGIGTTTASAKLDVVGNSACALEVSGANDRDILVTSSITTGSFWRNSLVVQADSLTSGGAGLFYSNSATFTGTGGNNAGLLNVIVDHTSATGNALHIKQDCTGNGVYIDQNGNGRAIFIDSENTTSDGVDINSSAATTGRGLYVHNDSTAWSGSTGFVDFKLDNPSSTGTLLYLRHDGTGAGVNMVGCAIVGDEVDNGNSSTADTIVWNKGNIQKSTLTDNCTFTFTAPSAEGSFMLRLVQDGTGSRTVTWPASVKWPGGTAPTLSTAAGAVDIVTFIYDGTNYYGVSQLNFS